MIRAFSVVKHIPFDVFFNYFKGFFKFKHVISTYGVWPDF